MKVTGAILAGGEGRRLGGQDKARVMLAGRWLGAHVATRIAPQVTNLVVVARGDPARLALLDLPVIADGIPGGAGPLAGLLGALDHAVETGADAVLTVSVDTPFLPADLCQRLQQAIGDRPAAIAVAGRRRHPVCGLWRVALRDLLRAALAGGLRRVDDLANGIGAAEARFDDPDAFFNINTPQDLHDAERIARNHTQPAQPRPSHFDRIVIVDWSARAAPSPRKHSADAIWLGLAGPNGTETRYCRTRHEAEANLVEIFEDARRRGQRILAGFDFPLGYPQGAARQIAGAPEAFALWDWLAAQITDGPDNRNNRFEIADLLNQRLPGRGPFWGRPGNLALPNLPERKLADYGPDLPERRRVERAVPRAQPVWKLYTTGSVGSQALLGLPVLARLRQRFGASVWPFDGCDKAVVLAEIYPALIDDAVRAAKGADDIKDAVQVRLLADALWRLQARGQLAAALDAAPEWPGRAEEGWILGVGVEDALRAAAWSCVS